MYLDPSLLESWCFYFRAVRDKFIPKILNKYLINYTLNKKLHPQNLLVSSVLL